jgi:hypothetical protein
MRELQIAKNDGNDEVKSASSKREGKLTLLLAIEKVVELSEGSKLNDEFFTNAKKYIAYIT